MSEFSLKYQDPEFGKYVEVKLDGDKTWHEVSEEFVTFLQTCGYVLTREDFARYWNEGEETSNFNPFGSINFSDQALNTMAGTVSDFTDTITIDPYTPAFGSTFTNAPLDFSNPLNFKGL